MDVPSTLRDHLAPVRAWRDDADLDAAACAFGCVLHGPAGELVALTWTRVDERGVPRELEVLRVVRGVTQRRRIDVALAPAVLDAWVETVAREAEDGELAAWRGTSAGPPPWVPLYARSMGHVEGFRRAESLVTAAATLSHALARYRPLVALGGVAAGALGDQWLFVERAPLEHRLFVVRARGEHARLVARFPHEPAPCDAPSEALVCAAPLGIVDAFYTPDHRSLLLVLERATSAEGRRRWTELVVLADAAALPRDEPPLVALERSLAAGAAPLRWYLRPAEPDASNACVPACARYFEDGRFWLVRPDRARDGVVPAVRLVRGDELTSDPRGEGGRFDLRDPGALARALAAGPALGARSIVAREALVASDGVLLAPYVELGAPHGPARLWLVLEGDEYVLRYRASAERPFVELDRRPALHATSGAASAGPAPGPSRQPSSPGIVRVFVPPRLGLPMLVVGAALLEPESARGGPTLGFFHFVVRSLDAVDAERSATTEAPR